MKVRMGPSGVHLFDRATGLNILLDEVHAEKTSWSAAPRYISIALTNICDLKCPHCYAPKNRASLDPETISKWLDELDILGCLGVGFGGGEPTLYKHLMEVCQYASKNTQLAVSFTTHAHHISDDMASRIAGNVNFIRVSMDGVGRTYEMLRGRSFAALRSRLETIRTISPFGINYVVNTWTLRDLDAATALAEDVGASEFLLLPEQPVRGIGGIDTHTTNSLRNWVNQYQGKVRLAISESGAEGFPTCNPFINEVGLRAYAHIDATGYIKSSSYDSEGIYIGAGTVAQALTALQEKLR